MSLSVIRSCLLCTQIAWSASAAAATTITPDPPDIVVTATRVPTPLDQVLAPMLVIDRARIEDSAATDAADLLRFNAGLDLARNGGPGQTTSLFIRGAESNHTLVLVDGVRINPGTIGLAGLQNISPSMIERIEVVKGPRSALYGTDAIGGVINVITRRGADTGWTAELGYGDYDTQEANVTGGFATDRIEFDLGVSWLDSDGFPTRTDDDTDRGYENFNGMAQLRGAGNVGVFGLLPHAGRPGFRHDHECAHGRLAGRRVRAPGAGCVPARGSHPAEPVAGLPRDAPRRCECPGRLARGHS